MQHPYLAAMVCFAIGTYLIWINVQRLRLNQYLRAHGILTSSVITEARLTRQKDDVISHFKVCFQDRSHRLYEAKFSAKDSEEEFLYLVGGEVQVYYDPMRPERTALATDIKSTGAYYGLLLGAVIIACSFYHIWEAQSHIHVI